MSEPRRPRLTALEITILAALAVALCLLPFVAHGSESERVYVASAKVRAALSSQAELPDAPPSVVLPNVPKPVKPRGMSLEITGEPFSAPNELAAKKHEVTVYSATWCGPCQQMKKAVGNGDDSVSITWVTSAPPRGIPESYPTCCWRDSSGTLRYSSGVKTLAELKALIERSQPKSGGQSRLALDQVADVLDSVRPRRCRRGRFDVLSFGKGGDL